MQREITRLSQQLSRLQSQVDALLHANTSPVPSHSEPTIDPNGTYRGRSMLAMGQRIESHSQQLTSMDDGDDVGGFMHHL